MRLIEATDKLTKYFITRFVSYRKPPRDISGASMNVSRLKIISVAYLVDYCFSC